ncbi:MAG: histidine--tRNA ligase [Chloroflexi bacterium RBG_16_63_12]|nr:MAG: histidine--tRNA ligase [Chloroflexi bacterium RBG_16_63_12]
MKPKIQSVKGTRDFYPEQMALRNWLYGNMKAASQLFGYQEYDGPFVETLDLYAAKSGEELVKEQSFVFNDRGGDQITLRPELTPSLARMVAARQAQLLRPIRWWSFGPFWRYERPQKGRSREFFQWNIDLLGVDSPAADAELAAVAVTFFRLVGFTSDEVKLQFNNRRLMDAEVAALGLADKKLAVFRLIDRRDKMSAEAWEKYASEQGVSPQQLDELKAILANRDLWRKSDECVAFVEAAGALGIADYLEYEPTVVRGLDYYTGTVLEARDREGQFRAILGGGRYDNLVGDVGGERLPGVGFAMGDMVIGLMAQQYGKVPPLRPSPAEVLVTVFDRAGLADALKLAGELRAAGVRAEWYPEAAKLDKQLKYADATGVRFAIIIGPDEAAQGEVSLKDLQNRTQAALPRAQLAAEIRRRTNVR